MTNPKFLIEKCLRELRKTQLALQSERDPIRITKHTKNLAIKANFLQVLKSGGKGKVYIDPGSIKPPPPLSKEPRKASKTWDWFEVTTLPGADEYLPWHQC